MSSKNQLLARYTAQLTAHPLRTKAITAGELDYPRPPRSSVRSLLTLPTSRYNTGILSFLQEILATHLAGIPTRPAKSSNPITHVLASLKVDARAFKMGAYGFLVSAPLGHVLVGKLQKTFAGRKLALILASNLIVSPIQTVGECFNRWVRGEVSTYLFYSVFDLHGSYWRCKEPC